MSEKRQKLVLVGMITVLVILIVIGVYLFYRLQQLTRLTQQVPERVVETVVVTKEVPVEATKIVVVTATPTQVVPTSTPVPTPVPPTPAQSCFFDLRKSVRGLLGVTITNDRSDWDGKANGLVSMVKVSCGKATLHFEWWGPEGKWTDLMEDYEVEWLSGEYNLQELYFPSGKRQLNDTLQWVTVSPGAKVVLIEHDPDDPNYPGIKIQLVCPTDDP